MKYCNLLHNTTTYDNILYCTIVYYNRLYKYYNIP